MMRISSVTMFEQGAASINRQQADFLETSQQIASGRRVVNPSDDPQAAARAVRVDQARSVTEQFNDSRVSARNSLAQTESVLNSISDATTSAKTLLVQASSDTLSNVDRESVASELRGIYETMLGQANATDGNGRYLFGGYNDSAPPFLKQNDGSVDYQGDDNTRRQRIDASREMRVNENGQSVFRSVPSGAGYIAQGVRTDDGGNRVSMSNQGTVTFQGPRISDVSDDGYGSDFRLTFAKDDGAPTVSVQRHEDGSWKDYKPDGDDSLQDKAYVSGDSLSFGGIDVTLSGEPEDGDQLLITQAASDLREPDLFRTMNTAIKALESPLQTPADQANLRNTLNASMRELDNALDNVLTVRASAGARLNELDVVDAVAGNRMLNYEQTLSDLVDLDYVEAISDYSLRQVGLQASQQAFADIRGTSLFDYLR